MNTGEARIALIEFETLEANWDSYGAKPIEQVAIFEASCILDTLTVVPLPCGGVQIELGGMEIEINPDGTVGDVLT